MEDTVSLGGNIELSGFREIDSGSMIILKKIVGNYSKKFSGMSPNLELLSLHMKNVHLTSGSEKYELHGKVISNGAIHTSATTDRNLFFALDKVLKNIEKNIRN